MANILNQTPSNFATNVVRNAFITVQFDTLVDRSTINEATVILVNTSSQDIIGGVTGYIVGTSTITFQLFEILNVNTNYTFIIVGGVNGVYALNPHVPLINNSYLFTFTTGSTIDPNIALAPRSSYTDGPYFQGQSGIYKETWDRTGEAVTHIVTTAAAVGPSGRIIPAPYGASIYLPPSGTANPHAFTVISTTPADGSMGIYASGVTINFNNAIASMSTWGVTVEDIFGWEVVDENELHNYEITVSGTVCHINTISGDQFRPVSTYEFILNNVVDVYGNTMPLVSLKFDTKYIYYYSTIQIIRRHIGTFIKDIPDIDIKNSIYENSKWTFDNARYPFSADEPTQDAINYATYKTELELVYRDYFNGGPTISKRLGDFAIQKNSGYQKILMMKIDNLVGYVDRAKYNLTGRSNVQGAVKSLNDPRYPAWHRMYWLDFEKSYQFYMRGFLGYGFGGFFGYDRFAWGIW